MAEWSIAAVLKTVDPHGSGGSNPSLSAAVCKTIRISKLQTHFADFLFLNIPSNRRHCIKRPPFQEPIFRFHVLQKFVPKFRKVGDFTLVSIDLLFNLFQNSFLFLGFSMENNPSLWGVSTYNPFRWAYLSEPLA